MHARQRAILASEQTTLSKTYQCTWRFTSGLGISHPTENGLSLDPLTGSVYLPASAVKGLCRRGAELAHDNRILDEQTNFSQTCLLLGSDPTKQTEVKAKPQRGVIRFLDAYPADWPTLEVDISNNHYTSYYKRIRENHPSAPIDPDEHSAPDEREDPVPVYFLTTARDTRFIFRLQAINRSTIGSAQARRWEVQAHQWLELALLVLGAGAKTSAGYGQMIQVEPTEPVPDEDPTGLAAQLRQQINALTPAQMGKIAGLITQLETITDPDTQRQLTQMLCKKCNAKAGKTLRANSALSRYLD
ncbi:MAG: type III-B CRISPR module RAMP protein Cmr6 [Gammaproteobacteria bacterium]|nr:type III-B CRISPR module RAMP protein Cmr6 [Gammaproteobacteria bacterium]